MKYDPKKVAVFSLFIILIISALLFFFVFYPKISANKPVPSSKNETDKSPNAEDNKELIAMVGKLMKLPEGEDPVVATVSDKSKLAGQQFFADSKNGDKVIIYLKAKKAILYDPVAGKIIDIGPIALPSPQSSTPAPVEPALTSSPTVTPSPAARPTQSTPTITPTTTP